MYEWRYSREFKFTIIGSKSAHQPLKRLRYISMTCGLRTQSAANAEERVIARQCDAAVLACHKIDNALMTLKDSLYILQRTRLSRCSKVSGSFFFSRRVETRTRGLSKPVAITDGGDPGLFYLKPTPPRRSVCLLSNRSHLTPTTSQGKHESEKVSIDCLPTFTLETFQLPRRSPAPILGPLPR